MAGCIRRRAAPPGRETAGEYRYFSELQVGALRGVNVDHAQGKGEELTLRRRDAPEGMSVAFIRR